MQKTIGINALILEVLNIDDDKNWLQVASQLITSQLLWISCSSCQLGKYRARRIRMDNAINK